MKRAAGGHHDRWYWLVTRRLRGWPRDPLFHFLCIGTTLFALYLLVTPPQAEEPGSEIQLTEDDLRQVDIAWMAKWQRPPTPTERQDLLDAKIREEVLYREALAMGLEQDDVIVRRRLGQKLEFLLEDVSDVRDPTQAELEAWYERNGSQFAAAGVVTFRHIYFSPDVRGERARADAARVLTTLGKTEASGIAGMGDRFPDQAYYAERSTNELANVFGTEFAEALFKLQPGRWHGPVQSGMGWHLVRIDAMTPKSIPRFDEVDRAQVQSAWLDSQRAKSKSRAFEAMRAKYKVVFPAERDT